MFCESVKHKSRLFNPEAGELLKEIFDEIDDISSREGVPSIRTIPDGNKDRFIFRARQADDDPTRIKIIHFPSSELGSPPPSIVLGGRMNPPKSLFYGAFEPDTCISEIRLPVGSTGITGKFELINPLRILDLTTFDDLQISISLFHPDYIRKASHLLFLKDFHKGI